MRRDPVYIVLILELVALLGFVLLGVVFPAKRYYDSQPEYIEYCHGKHDVAGPCEDGDTNRIRVPVRPQANSDGSGGFASPLSRRFSMRSIAFTIAAAENSTAAIRSIRNVTVSWIADWTLVKDMNPNRAASSASMNSRMAIVGFLLGGPPSLYTGCATEADAA